uniref:PDZ domain-containing protein n=1 Tax=Eutreptiella gymnastica TaxID=73025 RepID=A0A7S4CZG1_9EUGL|mmetsp:Transcript_100727/g.170331  ORF Transcript_100727/g.170331 Transcript_100727/m.170331 type:complete len:839 (-) Transcript_100727:306-2822(-)
MDSGHGSQPELGSGNALVAASGSPAGLPQAPAPPELIKWGSSKHFAVPWGTDAFTCECCFCHNKQRVPLYNYFTYCLKCGRLPLEWIPSDNEPVLTYGMMQKNAGILGGGVDMMVRCEYCDLPLNMADYKDHEMRCKVTRESKAKWQKLKPRIGLDTLPEKVDNPETGEPISGVVVKRVKSKGMPKTSELSIEVGDLITHWNAIGLESKEEYEAQLSQRKPGDHVKLRIWRAGELFFARIRIGAQISESQYEILKSVVEGETDDDVITKCDKVIVNDKQHWIWGISLATDEDASEPPSPERAVAPVPIPMITHEEAEEEEDETMQVIVQEAHAKLSALKPRIGFKVAGDPESGAVKISEVLDQGLPDDESQQVQVGDVITSWTGVPTRNVRTFEKVLLGLTFGQDTAMRLVRNGIELLADIKIGAQISEADTQVLMRVTGGGRESDDLAKVKQIVVDDSRHVVWKLVIISQHKLMQDEAIENATDAIQQLEARLGLKVVATTWFNPRTGEDMKALKVFGLHFKVPRGSDQHIQVGDILFTLDGTALASTDVYQDLVARMQPGDNIQIELMRGLRPGTADIRVGAQILESESRFLHDVVDKVREDPESLQRVKLFSNIDDDRHVLWGIKISWRPELTGEDFDEGEQGDATRRRKRKRWPMKKDDRDPKLIAADKLDLLKPRLGLSVQEQSYTDPFTADLCVGCRVMHVGPEGLPSDFDEQVRVGDIITRWKGRAVISPQVFSELLASHYPGDDVAICILRAGEPGTADVKIGAQISKTEAAVLKRVSEVCLSFATEDNPARYRRGTSLVRARRTWGAMRGAAPSFGCGKAENFRYGGRS